MFIFQVNLPVLNPGGNQLPDINPNGNNNNPPPAPNNPAPVDGFIHAGDDIFNRPAVQARESNLPMPENPLPGDVGGNVRREIRLGLEVGTAAYGTWRFIRIAQAARAGQQALTAARGVSFTGARWIPVAGLVVAAADVVIDGVIAARTPKASDVIQNLRESLTQAGLTRAQINRMKELADSDPEALRRYMRDECHVNSADIDKLIDDEESGIKVIKKAKDEANNDAKQNAALTGGGAVAGAVIGGIIGSIVPGPGTVAGIVVGAAVGSAIGGAVNLARRFFRLW